jgi:glycosyltransferase involved in cell wall biosynthesis
MKILAIGSKNSSKRNVFSGQSTMFDGLVDALHKKGKNIDVINISSVFNTRSSGRFSFLRAIEYVGIIANVFYKICVNKYSMLYFTTAQSKAGFIRDYIIVAIAYQFGIKIYTHQFGANYSGFYDSLSPFLKKKLIKMLNRAHKIIVEGDYTKKQFSFLEDYSDKVVVIPNGLPNKDMKVKYESKTYDKSQPFNMLYLSNLIVSKVYFDVLKAVDLLVNTYKRNVHCVFVGKFIVTADVQQNVNELETFFFEYIKQHNLATNVEYFEGLYGDLKWEAYNKSHVFLLPSFYINEGQPVSVLEAMACGNVCVVTNYRMIPDMVNIDNGLFVDAKSPESIAEKVMYLMDNPTTYGGMSSAAITKYHTNYTFNVYGEKMLNLFES